MEKYNYDQERKILIDEVEKQQALAREAMEKVYDMFSQAPASICLLRGPQHIFQLANDHYLQLISRKDIIGKTVREVLPEVEGQGLFELLDHVYTTGETFTAHERLTKVKISPTGKLVDLYSNFIYQPYRNAQNEIEGVFFFSQNVTEQVLLRKEIEKSEQQYRQIVETAQEGIWLVDSNHQTTFVNNKLCEIFGYEEKEIIGKNVSLFVKEGPKNLFCSKNENFEFQSVSKDGKDIWINISTNPIFGEDGNYKGALAMVSNITERKKLDERNSFKANLLNTIGQAVVAVDANGIVSYWNKAAEKIYGWGEEEAIGKNIIDLTPSQQTVEQAKEIMAQLIQGNTWSGEFLVKRKDGSEFPALVSDSPIYDARKNLVGVIGVSSDITEKKKLENLLDEANRLARFGNWEYDVDKNFLYWSGITKEIKEVDNNFIPDVATAIHFYKGGFNRDLIADAVKQGLEQGKPWDLELQIVTGKGNERWVRTIGKAEFINGRCIRLYGSFQDIDDRKQNEEKLQQSEARFRALVENNYGAIVLRNDKLQVIYRTPNTEKILGYADEERIGQMLESIIHPDDIRAVKKHEKLLLRNAGKTFSIVFRTRHKNGHYVWVEVITTNLLHEPSVKAIVSNFRDITDRRNFEEQQELMASIVNSSDDAIISISTEGIITSWNKGAQSLYHYTAEEVIGENFSCVIPPYKAHEEGEILTKVINGEHLEHYETE
ncbi:MAG: PAS domain S-box protein, partial [Chitinophagaceae bacterium]